MIVDRHTHDRICLFSRAFYLCWTLLSNSRVKMVYAIWNLYLRFSHADLSFYVLTMVYHYGLCTARFFAATVLVLLSFTLHVRRSWRSHLIISSNYIKLGTESLTIPSVVQWINRSISRSQYTESISHSTYLVPLLLYLQFQLT